MKDALDQQFLEHARAAWDPAFLNQPDRAGEMSKRAAGALVKRWQKRFFVLKHDKLFYFHDREDREPAGVLFLEPSTTLQHTHLESLTQASQFVIVLFVMNSCSLDSQRCYFQRHYHLGVSVEADFIDWYNAIARILQQPALCVSRPIAMKGPTGAAAFHRTHNKVAAFDPGRSDGAKGTIGTATPSLGLSSTPPSPAKGSEYRARRISDCSSRLKAWTAAVPPNQPGITEEDAEELHPSAHLTGGCSAPSAAPSLDQLPATKLRQLKDEVVALASKFSTLPATMAPLILAEISKFLRRLTIELETCRDRYLVTLSSAHFGDKLAQFYALLIQNLRSLNDSILDTLQAAEPAPEPLPPPPASRTHTKSPSRSPPPTLDLSIDPAMMVNLLGDVERSLDDLVQFSTCLSKVDDIFEFTSEKLRDMLQHSLGSLPCGVVHQDVILDVAVNLSAVDRMMFMLCLDVAHISALGLPGSAASGAAGSGQPLVLDDAPIERFFKRVRQFCAAFDELCSTLVQTCQLSDADLTAAKSEILGSIHAILGDMAEQVDMLKAALHQRSSSPPPVSLDVLLLHTNYFAYLISCKLMDLITDIEGISSDHEEHLRYMNSLLASMLRDIPLPQSVSLSDLCLAMAETDLTVIGTQPKRSWRATGRRASGEASVRSLETAPETPDSGDGIEIGPGGTRLTLGRSTAIRRHGRPPAPSGQHLSRSMDALRTPGGVLDGATPASATSLGRIAEAAGLDSDYSVNIIVSKSIAEYIRHILAITTAVRQQVGFDASGELHSAGPLASDEFELLQMLGAMGNLCAEIEEEHESMEAELLTPALQRKLRHAKTCLFVASARLGLSLKTASGEVPPPDATHHLLQDVSAVEQACHAVLTVINDIVKSQIAAMAPTPESKAPAARPTVEATEADAQAVSALLCIEEEAYMTRLVFRDAEHSTSSPQLKGAPLAQLVERLTYHSRPDAEFLNAFLLTYTTFTTSHALLELLIERYGLGPPEGLSAAQAELYAAKKIIPVKLRVFNVLKLWFKGYTDEWLRDPSLLARLRAFLPTLRRDFRKGTDDFEALVAKMLAAAGSATSQSVGPGRAPPAPALPRSLATAFTLLDVDPLEAARQLTLIEWGLFSHIKPAEFLGQAWNRKERQGQAPNVLAMIRHVNHVVYWVATELVGQASVRARTQYLKHFIAVAGKCRALNNYNALMAVLAGLSLAAVTRLKKTWEGVPTKARKALTELQELMSEGRAYKNYRQSLAASQPPCLPFLGVYLTDLVFIETGNRDWLGEPDAAIINFDKRARVAKIIDEIRSFQRTPYQFTPVPPIQAYVQGAQVQDEDAVYEASLRLEPRLTASAAGPGPGGT